MMMLDKVLMRRKVVRIQKSYMRQLPPNNLKNARKLSRSSKRLRALLPLSMNYRRNQHRGKRLKSKTLLKLTKTARTLTQMILKLEKKGLFATTAIEMSALMSSEIRAGLTSRLVTEYDSEKNYSIFINMT